ncbi:MAG: hypothetical protein FJ255_11035 [Phycisphaerae bacterium]|nr:hypothetical protein [Phycisphaerae bacterium]
MFDRVVMVDWSASSAVGPTRPSPDRCWLACGDRAQRCQPEYLRTRLEAQERIVDLAASCPGRVLVGMDFPFGYPREAGLPVGRRLCRLLAELIEDGPDGANTRFEAAAELNRRLERAHGPGQAPFWGHPRGRVLADLTPTKPRSCRLGEYRAVERLLRSWGLPPQSAFKLAGVGSVGSQTLLGLACVHRMLADRRLAARALLWPFETGSIPADAVVFAEIWPSLGEHARQPFEIKDARQVAAARDEVLDADDQATLLSAPDDPDAAAEGWILGVQPLTGAGPKASQPLAPARRVTSTGTSA